MTHLRIELNNIPETVSAAIIRKLYETALSIPEPNEGEEDSAYLSGTLLTPYAYKSHVDYLTERFSNLYINVTTDYYVEFEDPVIRQYCVAHYGDGVGVTQSAISAVEYNLSIDKMDDDLKSQVLSLNDFLYFTHNTISTGDNRCLYKFVNAQSIKFPSKTFNYAGNYSSNVIGWTTNLLTVDFSNAIFSVSSQNGVLFVINGNHKISLWSDSLLPKQTSYDRVGLFLNWSKLEKIIFPEGKTHFSENFLGCTSLLYVEFPVTTVSLGSGWNLGRDSGHNIPCIVVKAVTPPAWTGWNPNNTGGFGGGLGWALLPVAIYVPDNSVTAYKSVANGGTTNESLWANPDIQALIKPMSEMPQLYRDMGTVTQADIDRV